MGQKKRTFYNRQYCRLEPDLIESQAFRELSGRAAIRVLIRFHQKAWKRKSKGKKGIKTLQVTNQGEIVFPYSEALWLGWFKSAGTFQRVLVELIEQKGFIDLAEPGNWHEHKPARYGISERWRHYGTPNYQTVSMAEEKRKSL